MKELTYSNGHTLRTVRMGEDDVSLITFNEETQLAKIYYKDGTTATIKSPFISFVTLSN